MKIKFTLIIFLFLSLPFHQTFAQAFLNGDLTGTISASVAPPNWAQVPDTDPVSQATAAVSATSDITGLTGPVSGAGINGNPYSGTSYVTGLNVDNGSYIYQEGIQQSLGGLSVGMTYKITFWQTVNKQNNVTDDTGCWILYKDGTLIGTSAPTTETSPWGSNTKVWQRRSLTFTATLTTHLMKFLPIDDDANISNINGVRMAIDSITLSSVVLPTTFQMHAKKHNFGTQLSWQDDSYEEAKAYFIERSTDGIVFERIGSIPATQVNSMFTDEKPAYKNFYRILKVNKDGGSLASEVEQIDFEPEVRVQLFGSILSLQSPDQDTYLVKAYDLKGSLILSQPLQNTIDLSTLGQGFFIVQVLNEQKGKLVWVRKIVN